MKTFLTCSFLVGSILGYSVIGGQFMTVSDREYPVTISSTADDWIGFSLPFIGGFGTAAAIYSFMMLNND
jgi:hypothetical protein